MSEFQEITYPIALNYREHWKEWEAIRELVQNALDSSESYLMESVNGNLEISDKGKGLEVRHLLFGISEKSEDSRGKFGEGLKIALIVLKRLGFNCKILSNNLEIQVSTKVIAQQECLNLLYRNNGIPRVGTKVIIQGYQGKTFEERFRKKNMSDILFSDPKHGEIIQIPTVGSASDPKVGKLYVKDIYVSKLDNSAFSYNLRHVELEESRNMANESDMCYQLGYLWNEVNSLELWEAFFLAVKEGKYEKKAKMFLSFKNPEIVKSAFNNVFPKSVLKTSDSYEKEAIWRGYQVIDLFNSCEHSALFSLLDTDKDILMRESGEVHPEVNENMLTSEERENLETARKICLKIDPNQKIKPYYLGESTLGIAGNPIKLNKKILSNRQKVISVTVHELTHTYYKVDDMTDSMIRRLSDMAAKLLETYITSEFSTKLLENRVTNGNVQYRVSIPKDIVNKKWLTKGNHVIVTISKEGF